MNNDIERLERNKQKLIALGKHKQVFEMQRVTNMLKMFYEQDENVYKKG